MHALPLEIWDALPRLADLGAGPFGEDADMFGDTLDEAILDAPQGRNLPFKLQAIHELQTLLSFTDEEIDRIAQTCALLSISPTADVEEPPNWGRYPTYRAFWEAVLRAFENDPDVQKNTKS